MASITIRVPEELKRRMDECNENWSAVVRDAIEDRLLRTRRQEALRRIDRLRRGASVRAGPNESLSREVLRWRRRR